MLCLAALAFCRCDDKRVTVGDLTVEMLENPVGLDERTPRFGWQLRSDLRDVAQTSYRIVVAGSENDLKKEQNLIWDSGEVPSGESVWVEYGGPQLESRKDYFWKVRVTTNTGDETWSEPARWSMALLDDSDWQAGWIGIDSALNATDRMEGDSRLAARYLRKPFDVEGKVKNARLYISGLGLYECYINGKRVGESVLAPTATDYSTNVPYNTFDVSEFIKDKQNAIGVTLGNGRFFAMRLGDPSAGLLGSLRQFGFPKLLAQLEIEYENGERQVVVTDTTWRLTTDGPIVANNEFDGEEYDASKELGKWSEAGYDDSAWMNARSVGAPEGALHAQRNPNIRVMEEIDPVAISQLNDSTYILDMGQNMVGWLNVTLKGEKGEPVRLRFAETLKPDGSLYMDNLRGAKVTDVYIPAGDDVFSWEPRFTYHGFRFVEITGLKYKPELIIAAPRAWSECQRARPQEKEPEKSSVTGAGGLTSSRRQRQGAAAGSRENRQQGKGRPRICAPEHIMRTYRRFGIVIDNFRTTIQSSEPQDVKGRISFHVHIRLHGAVSGGEPRRCGLPGQRASVGAGR